MTFEQQPNWIAAAQQPPEKVPADAPRPVPLLFDAENRPITTLAGWVKRRVELAGRGWRFWERSLTGGQATNWKCWKRIGPKG